MTCLSNTFKPTIIVNLKKQTHFLFLILPFQSDKYEQVLPNLWSLKGIIVVFVSSSSGAGVAAKASVSDSVSSRLMVETIYGTISFWLLSVAVVGFMVLLTRSRMLYSSKTLLEFRKSALPVCDEHTPTCCTTGSGEQFPEIKHSTQKHQFTTNFNQL